MRKQSVNCKSVKNVQNYSLTFEVKFGLRQGDAFSLTLFNLALEKNSEKYKRTTESEFNWRIGDFSLLR